MYTTDHSINLFIRWSVVYILAKRYHFMSFLYDLIQQNLDS